MGVHEKAAMKESTTRLNLSIGITYLHLSFSTTRRGEKGGTRVVPINYKGGVGIYARILDSLLLIRKDAK